MNGRPELAISSEKICFIISLAHEFDVKDTPSEGVALHPPPDDEQISVLEDRPDDHSEEELRLFIDELNEDEQIDLVALAWLGRGDADLSDWEALRAEAVAAHNDRTADYLVGMPILGDFLEEGMNALGLSCES